VKGKSNERRQTERKHGGSGKDFGNGESVSDDEPLHKGHGTAV
jgi:hypothetical protein